MTDQNLSSLPTLADMTEEERAACQYMHAEVKGNDAPVVILDPCWKDGGARLLYPSGFVKPTPTDWDLITPHPDPPRMMWPCDQCPPEGEAE